MIWQQTCMNTQQYKTIGHEDARHLISKMLLTVLHCHMSQRLPKICHLFYNMADYPKGIIRFLCRRQSWLQCEQSVGSSFGSCLASSVCVHGWVAAASLPLSLPVIFTSHLPRHHHAALILVDFLHISSSHHHPLLLRVMLCMAPHEFLPTQLSILHVQYCTKNSITLSW